MTVPDILPGPNRRFARVALAGYYGHGNFGDDLMAILFGLSLGELGIDFVVYRLSPQYAQQFRFRTESDPAKLLAEAGILLWGGGGLLVSWSPILYSLLFRGVSRDYSGLVKGAKDSGVELYALSVGGSGRYPPCLSPKYKQEFLSSARYVTVRNPQDLGLLKRNGIGGDFYPDIVWQTPDRFPVDCRKGEKKRIGIDLYLSILARKQALYILPILWSIARIRKDCEFIFMDSTNALARPDRGLGRLIRGFNIQSYQFRNIESDIQFLASLDLLISSRLHAPMVCMGYGVPVLSLFSEDKTVLMMRNLGLSHFHIGHGQVRQWISLFATQERLNAYIRNFPFPDIEKLRTDSYGHQARLRTILS